MSKLFAVYDLAANETVSEHDTEQEAVKAAKEHSFIAPCQVIKQSKPRKYHVLLVRSHGKWGIDFGDYDKSIVRQEYRDNLHHTDRTQMQIVTCEDDTQEAIDKLVKGLNK